MSPLPDLIRDKLVGGGINPQGVAVRDEKLLGTNCSAVQLFSFKEGERVFRVISKKSRLDSKYFGEITKDYAAMKHHLGDLIPNQSFFLEKKEGDRELISALCTPVTIAYDIFASTENWKSFLQERDKNPQLQDDIDMFIVGYKKLLGEGISLDLYGDENLVITREGRLRYIDSFMVNFSGRKSLIGVSEANFQKIQVLGTL